ncbi:MAG TPA: TetR/AcrR family transcriptional regulator [Chloroflexota bacterium]
MLSSVGRRREHNARTASALLDAAEQILQEGGVEALSVRSVAARIGTSTRAVYSVFGSKEQLLVALGVRAFEMLGAGVAALPVSDDPAADLVAAGASVFRPFALEHPALFRVAMQHAPAWNQMPVEVLGASTHAFGLLVTRVRRVQEAGLLGSHSVETATNAFHALCEGLAVGELRCGSPPGYDEKFWWEALSCLVDGFGRDLAPDGHLRESSQALGST